MRLPFCLGRLPSAVVGLLLMATISMVATAEEENFVLPEKGSVVSLNEIKAICAHFGLESLWTKIKADPPVRPFVSDGCTSWVDKTQGRSIYPACFLHDLKYWAGYPGEKVERLVADAELLIDVARILENTAMAETMYAGVRVGGTEHLGAKFSWGFGRQGD